MTLETTCNNILYISAQRVTVRGRNTEFSHIFLQDKQESYPSLRHNQLLWYRIRNINVCLTFFFKYKIEVNVAGHTQNSSIKTPIDTSGSFEIESFQLYPYRCWTHFKCQHFQELDNFISQRIQCKMSLCHKNIQ